MDETMIWSCGDEDCDVPDGYADLSYGPACAAALPDEPTPVVDGQLTDAQQAWYDENFTGTIGGQKT